MGIPGLVAAGIMVKEPIVTAYAAADSRQAQQSADNHQSHDPHVSQLLLGNGFAGPVVAGPGLGRPDRVRDGDALPPYALATVLHFHAMTDKAGAVFCPTRTAESLGAPAVYSTRMSPWF